EGQGANGILVDGIHTIVNCDCNNPAPTELAALAPGGLSNLLIAGNGTIEGATNGIHLAWGANIDLSTELDVLGPTEAITGDNTVDIVTTFIEDLDISNYDLWAIEDAKVQIVDNDTIQGFANNGILVEGVHRSAPCVPCEGGEGGTVAPVDTSPDLLIGGV